jgi:hypothetical protein
VQILKEIKSPEVVTADLKRVRFDFCISAELKDFSWKLVLSRDVPATTLHPQTGAIYGFTFMIGNGNTSLSWPQLGTAKRFYSTKSTGPDRKSCPLRRSFASIDQFRGR